MLWRLCTGYLAVTFLISATAPQEKIETTQADVTPSIVQTVRTEYYDVRGTDEASINASLNASAPRRSDGSRAMGATRHYFRYTAQQDKHDDICTVSELKIEIQSTVRLPRLVSEASLPAQLRARWQIFMEGLRVHEAGHVRIQKDHLQDIRTAALGSRCDCLQSAIYAAAAKVEALQRAYDTETRDGVTQGAVLR